MRSLSLVMSECSLSGRGQGQVSNFYIVDLKNFPTASRRYTGDIHNSTVVGLFTTPIRQWKRLERVTVECTCLLHIGPPYPSNFITSIYSGLVVQYIVQYFICNSNLETLQSKLGPLCWVCQQTLRNWQFWYYCWRFQQKACRHCNIHYPKKQTFSTKKKHYLVQWPM